MRHKLVLASLLLSTMLPTIAKADVSIGINLALYPNLVQVPGYPVYYAPQMDSNYFFYDGKYWVYTNDSWYDSSWYNGPWEMVDSEIVPLYVLRIPVRYYRQPPTYFRGWSGYSPPHWGEHWGNDWSQHHLDWDHWNHNATPAAAPLPVYQKQYSGTHYPQANQQQQLQQANYHYQPPRVPVQQAGQPQRVHNAPASAPPVMPPLKSNSNTGAHASQNSNQHTEQRNNHPTNAQQPKIAAPRTSSPAPQPRSVPVQKPSPIINAPIQPRAQQPKQHAAEHQLPPAPRAQETLSHDQQHGQQQEHREKDHD